MLFSVFCVNVHVCASNACTYTRRVCGFVGWRDRLFETWPPGPVGFKKGLFHVPFPSGVRLKLSCLNQVLPYVKYLLGYLRILNRSFCEAGEKHWRCVACYGVNQTLAAFNRKYTLCHLVFLIPCQISPTWPVRDVHSKLERNPYEIA